MLGPYDLRAIMASLQIEIVNSRRLTTIDLSRKRGLLAQQYKFASNQISQAKSKKDIMPMLRMQSAGLSINNVLVTKSSMHQPNLNNNQHLNKTSEV
jgi:hypothetical protein